MISREVNDFCILGKQTSDVFDNLHVGLWPIAFAELPHVDDISVKNNFSRLDRFQVAEEFFRTAAICAQMNVR